jgi:flavin reductase (DIM6/NTAB) family NADH-FMN oxidoreductase RutF
MQIQAKLEEAIGRKYPEQIVLATARVSKDRYNPITLGWTMITSHNPFMMAISVGITRYSLEVIRKAGEFVICLPSASMAEDALYFGTHSGGDVDKIKERGAAVQPARSIEGVLFSDAVANFECTLSSELRTGDHVIFVGTVVCSHMNEDREATRLYTVGAGYRMGSVEEIL